MSNPLHPWLSARWSAALALQIFALSASAQSDGLLEAVQLHRPDALDLAAIELNQCEQAACPRLRELTLLAAFLSLSRGDPSKAAERLSRAKPPLGLEPFYEFYRADAAFYLGHYQEAAERFSHALSQAPKALSLRAAARAGEAYWRSGDPAAASPLLERAASELDLPELYQERAEVRSRLDQSDLAIADLKTIAVRFPSHPYAATAIATLEGLGLQPLTFEERLARVRSLTETDPSAALGEAQQIQLRRLARGATAKATLALAKLPALFALDRDELAALEVQTARRGTDDVAAEARLLWAKRLLHLNQNAKARSELVSLERRYRRTPFSDEAGYLIGWLDLQSGVLDRAVADFSRYRRAHPRSRHRDESYWYEALAFLRSARPHEAIVRLSSLVSEQPGSQLVPQALYWIARAKEVPTGQGSSSADYRRIIDQFPASYYSLLSTARILERKESPPAPFPPAPSLPEAEMPPPLRPAELLSRAGLFNDAQSEIRYQSSAIRSAAQALRQGLALQKLGAFGDARAIAARWLWGQAYTERSPEALALFYPRPFARAVQAEAQQRRVDPFFVYAIMARESGFRPGEKSAANARGLMQLRPPTALAIAERLSLPPPSPDELFSPNLNLQLGVWYLGQLLERFKHPALCAAAYNAGPMVIPTWVAERAGAPLDLFVELIPYKETRGYVKQVLADDFVYHSLYQPSDPSTVDLALPSQIGEGINF